MKEFDDEYKYGVFENDQLIELFEQRDEAEEMAAKLGKDEEIGEKLLQEDEGKQAAFKPGDRLIRTMDYKSKNGKYHMPAGTIVTYVRSNPNNPKSVEVSLEGETYWMWASRLKHVGKEATTKNEFSIFSIGGVESDAGNPVLKTNATYAKKDTLEVEEDLFVNYETSGFGSTDQLIIEVRDNGKGVGDGVVARIKPTPNKSATAKIALSGKSISYDTKYIVQMYRTAKNGTTIKFPDGGRHIETVQFEIMKLRKAPEDEGKNLLAYALYAEGKDLEEFRMIRDVVYNRIKLVKHRSGFAKDLGGKDLIATLNHVTVNDKVQFESVVERSSLDKGEIYDNYQKDYLGVGKITTPPMGAVNPENVAMINDAIKAAKESHKYKNAEHGNYVWFWKNSYPPAKDAIRESKFSYHSGNNYWKSTGLESVLEGEKKK